jgi:hypothetical protein
MRRRGRVRVDQIPEWVLSADGERHEEWDLWCDEVGFSKVDLLYESVQRKRAANRAAYEGGAA